MRILFDQATPVPMTLKGFERFDLGAMVHRLPRPDGR
jgi:hypothetical protein